MKKQQLLIISPVFIAALIAFAFVTYSQPSDAKPGITWSPPSLSEELETGQSTSTTVSFTSGSSVRNVTVEVAPEIAPYVSVSPDSFNTLTSGTSYDLDVTFNAPADASAGEYEGTIYIQQRKRTLAKSLPVEVEIIATYEGTEYEDEQYNFTLYIPSEYLSNEKLVRHPSILSNRTFASPEGAPKISVSVYANSTMLPITDWYSDTLSDKEFTLPDSSVRVVREVTVAGNPAIELESDVMGYTMVRTYVAHDDVVIGIRTSVSDSFPIPDEYYHILDSLELH